MNCPACNGSVARLLLPAAKLRAKADVWCCRECGSAYFEERVWEKSDDYWMAGDQNAVYSEGRVALGRNRRFGARLDLLERFGPVGSLLDIGCGRGDFLASAYDRGWSVHGIEPSREVRSVRGEIEPNIVRCTFEQVSEDLGAFDAVTMWDVIEHVDEPAKDMAKISRLLKPGGILALETPNEKGLFKRIARMLAAIGFSGFLDFVYYLPHRVSFSGRGLRLMGDGVGLETVYTKTATTDTAFAVEKVDCHYPRGIKASLVKAFVPAIAASARIMGIGNKLIVIMRKRG